MEKLGSERGAMPFAMIAVTILLIASTYGAVCVYIERSNDKIENLTTELEAFDNAVEDVKNMVNRGMGEILADISRSDGGSMMERSETFDKRAEGWLKFQFPMSNGIVTVSLSDHDLVMKGESMKIVSVNSNDTDASTPVYLKAEGTLDVKMVSSSNSASRSVSISADGSSALPLVVTQASLFELAISGDMPLLTQLISYQLAALAQYRVIQGYGATSRYGDKGTESIITEKDVENAYNNAMAAIEMICFRSTSGDLDLASIEKVDLAESLIFKEGIIELDLAAIFAQAISSQVDALAGKWADYLMLDKILEVIDKLIDAAKKVSEKVYNALVGLSNFLTGKETPKVTASNYLKEIMEENGYSSSEYRRLTSSGTYSFGIPGGEYVLESNGIAYSINITGTNISIASPDQDILNWNGWNDFLNDYRNEHNSVRDYIREVLNLVCLQLSASYGLGTVKVSVNANDDKTFASSLASALSVTLNAQESSVGEALTYTVNNATFNDPMYGAMSKKIEKNKDDLFGISSIKSSIESGIRENIKNQILKQYGGTLLDSSMLETMVADQMASSEVKDAIKRYERMAEDRVSLFKKILNQVTDKGGVMKQILAIMMTSGLLVTDLYPLFKLRLGKLCEEIGDHLRMNAYDILELPGVSEFIVMDEYGYTNTEKMSVYRTDDLKISIVSATDMIDNTHYTDVFGDDVAAAYSATFKVYISSNISFTVTSSSPMSEMFGVNDSVHSGTASMRSEIIVPVMSGWALIGVDYVASHTMWDDISTFMKEVLIPVLEKILEPILKPLREFYRMVQSVMGMIGSALIELSGYAAKLVEKLYGIISDAIDTISSYMEKVTDLFGGALETIIDITVGSQTFGFRLYEFELKVTMNAKEIYQNHKTVLKIEMSLPISDLELSFVLDIKKDSKGYSFAASAGISAETWHFNLTLDPSMKIKSHVIEINALIRNTEIEIVLPEVVQYEKLDFKLSDIAGIGTILSNIPLPVPGMTGSIDAGLELKYNVPYKHGLVINEFESNPKGSDAGKEWVELYNSTSDAIDLTGYVLVFNSGDDKRYEITKGTIGKGETCVITIPKQMLNNNVGKKGVGECISLLDPDGKEVDKTPWKADTKDDDQTWQRKYDGSVEWVFKKGTKNAPNGGATLGNGVIMTMIKQCFIDAAMECFGKIKSITDVAGVAELFKQIIETAIKKIIKEIASCVVEASVFFEIRVSDAMGVAGTGIRLSVVIGPDLIKDGLNWILNEIKSLIFNIDNPSNVSLKTIFADDIHIRFTLFTDIRAPKFLGTLSDSGVSIGIVIQCNISAVCTLLGKDIGNWSVTFGVVMEDVPSSAIPSMFKTDKSKHADIWLIRGTFHKASA